MPPSNEKNLFYHVEIYNYTYNNKRNLTKNNKAISNNINTNNLKTQLVFINNSYHY